LTVAGKQTGEGIALSLRGFSTISFWADDVEAAAAWYQDFDILAAQQS